MIIYYHHDYYMPAEDSNQTQYFFTSKTAADKSRRQLARQYFVDRTDRDYYLNEHPIKSFELKGKAMIVHCLNQAAANGFVSCIEHAEEI